MTKHNFSPITKQADFEAALLYIAEEVKKLGNVVLGSDLAIDTLTIFSHFDLEYDFTESQVRSFGPESKFSHGLTLYVDSDFELAGQLIRYLGVRRPADDRPEIGYGDFPVPDYESFAKSQLSNNFVHPVQSGRGQVMLELRHPEFDVLGYVVDSQDH